jgi:hypothetical protein
MDCQHIVDLAYKHLGLKNVLKYFPENKGLIPRGDQTFVKIGLSF